MLRVLVYQMLFPNLIKFDALLNGGNLINFGRLPAHLQNILKRGALP